MVVNRQRVSTFDDLIVYIPCNSLLDNGLEDAIYYVERIGNKLDLTFVVYDSSNTNVGLNRIVRC